MGMRSRHNQRTTEAAMTLVITAILDVGIWRFAEGLATFKDHSAEVDLSGKTSFGLNDPMESRRPIGMRDPDDDIYTGFSHSFHRYCLTGIYKRSPQGMKGNKAYEGA